MRRRPELVRILCCDATYPNPLASTDALDKSLHTAARVGNSEIVAVLLEAEADMNWGGREETGLMNAAFRGYTSIVKKLLDAGADVNLTTNTGRAALTGAATHGCDATVEALLDSGSDIDSKDNQGRTALMAAAFEGHSGVIHILVERGADVHLVLHELQHSAGSCDMMRYLISKGADPTEVDAFGRNLLHVLHDANVEFIETLVNSGVNIAAVESVDGYTTLLSALSDDVEGKYDEGHTPLLAAAAEKDSEYVEILRRKGADITARTERGDTSLMLAREELDTPSMCWGYQWRTPAPTIILVAQCDLADIETMDSHGRTTIHQAARSRSVELVTHLVGRQVNLSAKTTKGNTPLAIAKQTMAWCADQEIDWTRRANAALLDSFSLYHSNQTRQVLHEMKEASRRIVELFAEQDAVDDGCSTEYEEEEQLWDDEWL
ncbi:hypothetical protein BST61_g94 [Cercospora zeina]